MLNRVIRYSFALVGAITGYTVLKLVIVSYEPDISENFNIVFYILASLISALIFYFSSKKVIESVTRFAERAETVIQNMTPQELIARSVGLVLGLIAANLITIPINKLDIINVPLSIIANILFASLGIVIAGTKKDDLDFLKSGSRDPKNNGVSVVCPKILDTNMIIDGRILDICRSGFIEGELVVPLFVLEELRHIADSADSVKRSKGRRGLDILNTLQKEFENRIKIVSFEFENNMEVDEKLIRAASQLGGKIMTIDYNLGKVASLHGVEVLNINELANAVKPLALPGEEFEIQVLKDGKESNQGIGYMNDGTMVVVEGGKKHIGETIPVMVTSVLQTAAGRMIFAKPLPTGENSV